MSPIPRLSTWSYGVIAMYAVIGYFLGNEFSPLLGAMLIVLGLIAGWFIAGKLTNAPISVKALSFGVPLSIMALVLILYTPKVEGLRVKAKALSGTWISQGDANPFTIRLNGDSALLSVESGLQNVAYRATFQHDSLILSAEGTAPLIWRIAKDTTRNELVLTAGGGVYFLKVSPK